MTQYLTIIYMLFIIDYYIIFVGAGGTAPIFGLCFTLNHSICSRSDAPYQRIAPCCALLSLFYVGVLAHGLYGHFALAWTPDG